MRNIINVSHKPLDTPFGRFQPYCRADFNLRHVYELANDVAECLLTNPNFREVQLLAKYIGPEKVYEFRDITNPNEGKIGIEMAKIEERIHRLKKTLQRSSNSGDIRAEIERLQRKHEALRDQITIRFPRGKLMEVSKQVWIVLKRYPLMFETETSEDLMANILRHINKHGYATVQVIRSLGGIGDILMTTPVLRALKERFGKQIILTYSTIPELMCLLENNPFIDRVTDWREDMDKYDFSVDLTRCCLSYEVKMQPKVDLHRTEIFLREIGVEQIQNMCPVLILSKEEEKWARGIMQEHGDKIKIGVQWQCESVARAWPNFPELVEKIYDRLRNVEVFIFDAKDRGWTGKGIKFFGLPLRKVASLIAEMDLFIAPDSGLMHIAGALGIPVIALFGPTDPACRIKFYSAVAAIQNMDVCPHAPCWYRTELCGYTDDTPRPCMASITAEEVFSRVRSFVTGEWKTLIIEREGGLGDILQLGGVLAEYKRVRPTQSITLAVRAKQYPIVADMLKYNPGVDAVVDVDLIGSTEEFMVVRDLSMTCGEYEVRCEGCVDLHRCQIYGRALGLYGSGVGPFYKVTDEEKKEAQAFLESMGLRGKKMVALQPRSAELYKDWPLPHFETLVLALREHEIRSLVFDTNMDYPFCWKEVFPIIGYTLRQQVAICNECDLVVGPDSLWLHVAGALGKPCVGLFGPSDGAVRIAQYPGSVVMQRASEELCGGPCWRNADVPCKLARDNPLISICMEKLKPEWVLAEILTFYRQNRLRSRFRKEDIG